MSKIFRYNRFFKYPFIIVLVLFTSCSGGQGSDTKENAGWKSLFDGVTLDGWKRYNADDIGSIWSVEDGTIKCDGRGRGEGSPGGGSLITIEKFADFELELQWKISEKGNSGIMYHVVEKPEYSHAYVTGPEYQLLDDPPGTGSYSVENKKTGSSYDMYAAPSTKKLNPTGEWNTTKIVYNDGKVEHWLNGEIVVEFDEKSEDFKDRYNNSKWSSGDFPSWNAYKEGSIALQDHGAIVWFKDIRIKRL
jgi:hypothetical protein